MKSLRFFISLSFLSLTVCGVSFLQADTFGERFLRYFPQADADEDGILSEKEKAAESKRIIQRFPRVDANGSGIPRRCYASESAVDRPIHRGSSEVTQLLLDAGADPTIRDAIKDTPLSWATWHRKP
jgi:hypothetical protein